MIIFSFVSALAAPTDPSNSCEISVRPPVGAPLKKGLKKGRKPAGAAKKKKAALTNDEELERRRRHNEAEKKRRAVLNNGFLKVN